jgi:glucose-1-phosphate adenylyltransferase
MDYSKLAEFHWENDAEITVAVQPVRMEDAPRFGLMKVGDDDRLVSFVEKPSDPDVLKDFISRPGTEKPLLGSMGLYLFNTDVLVDILKNTLDTDFGGEIIPKAIEDREVFAYPFEGYWEDIGTIRSFYDTNLSLLDPDAPFKFVDPVAPIFTRARFLPGSLVDDADLTKVLLSDGGIIKGARITNSIVGIRSIISENSVLTNSIMMGADYYDTAEKRNSGKGIPLGIGPNCQIDGAIIDKNARIAEGVRISPYPRGTNFNEQEWSVNDGIIVIPKRTILPPGTQIGPSD